MLDALLGAKDITINKRKKIPVPVEHIFCWARQQCWLCGDVLALGWLLHIGSSKKPSLR